MDGNRFARSTRMSWMGALALAFSCNGEPDDGCPGGLAPCEGRCVQLSSDREHCGACGQACGTDQICAAGECVLACTGGTEACGSSCVDTRIDRAHCGGCGNSCPDGEVCDAGTCAASCSGGAVSCGGGCVDVSADPEHCGGCGMACPEGLLCAAGKCVHQCNGGTSECGGACVDTDVHAKHCGACDQPCASGEQCQQGACTLACGELSECGGACVDTGVDPFHCGSCGNECAPAQACKSGACCAAAESNCDGACVDTATSASHCGGCGKACGAEEICADGVCSPKASCLALKKSNPSLADGTQILDPDGPGGAAPFIAYCDMTAHGGGWTLVARFSNQDDRNWVQTDGSWWYDKISESGVVSSPSARGDMIGQGFWRVAASEFRVTRGDLPVNQTAMHTTGSCLGNKTFRAFITGFGNFKNGAVWGKDSVQGSCDADYLSYADANNPWGGKTLGFHFVGFDGEIGGPEKVSFWSDWGGSELALNGSVIMFGGGGPDSGGGAHGIAVTEVDDSSFDGWGGDFGMTWAPQDKIFHDPGYDLNLYVR